MTVNNKHLIQAIENKDTIRVRSIIIGQISRDRRLNVYLSPSYIEYASEQLLLQGYQLCEEDEGEEKYTEKSDWDADLWSNLCISLQYHFSKSKLDHVIEVMNHLRAEGDLQFQVVDEEDRSIELQKKNRNVIEKQKHFRVTLGAGIGALAGLAAGAFFHKPIIGTLFGAVLGSGFSFLTNKDKEK